MESALGPFVPDGFEAPRGLVTEDLVLEPLGPDHNVSDHDAWTSSIAHIKATPGFADRGWPSECLSLEENRADLEQHAEPWHAPDYAARRA